MRIFSSGRARLISGGGGGSLLLADFFVTGCASGGALLLVAALSGSWTVIAGRVTSSLHFGVLTAQMPPPVRCKYLRGLLCS